MRTGLQDLGMTVSTLTRARLIAGMRPDKYVRIAAAIARTGPTNTTGIALSARRCPDRAAIIDERGTLSYRDLDERADALAAALHARSDHAAPTIAILCRNHRGFVETLAAADRLGSNVLLLNTSFAGPALADVVTREQPDLIIHDDEFGEIVAHAVSRAPETAVLTAWTDDPSAAETVDGLITAHRGQHPPKPTRSGKLILLTSGTTGTPKGAQRSGGGGPAELTAVLSRVPWRAEETTVVAAPMFHAWGYGQLVLGTLMSCTLVVRRKFDAEATMTLVDEHRATGLSVVPVMLDRIMDLPDGVRRRYRGSSLRFVTASGSRMRPDAVTAFMDQFGDVVYNNYNATEVGMVATATPADLRAAPETAGRPLRGVHVRILDGDGRAQPAGAPGEIVVRSSSQFDSYTTGANKDFHDGYMASGDLGYVDSG